MDKYVNKIKSILSTSIENMFSKRTSIKLIDGSDLEISRIGAAVISDFSELKLLSFTGERKFEVDGTGTLNIWEKTKEGEAPKQVAFQFKQTIVRFDDNTRNFEVSDIGVFTVLNQIS
jgi:hypothetical protein